MVHSVLNTYFAIINQILTHTVYNTSSHHFYLYYSNGLVPPPPLVFNGFLTNYIASLTNICTAYSPKAGVFLVSLLKKISEVTVEVVFVNSTLHLFKVLNNNFLYVMHLAYGIQAMWLVSDSLT